MFGVMQHLNIQICQTPEEASAKGFIYRQPDFKAIEIDEVVVVRNGTEEGNSTVDLVLVNELGEKFVVMLTGRLIKSIPC